MLTLTDRRSRGCQGIANAKHLLVCVFLTGMCAVHVSVADNHSLDQTPAFGMRPAFQPNQPGQQNGTFGWKSNDGPGSPYAIPQRTPGTTTRAGNLSRTQEEIQRERERREAELKRRIVERRYGAGGRLEGMGVYQPKDSDVPLLTNRLYKYENRKDYQRIKIHFDPIVMPRNWGQTFGRYTDSDIHKYVAHYAKIYGLDESLIHAMIKVESAGNPYAVSSKGAGGLMQLMPGTAKDLKVRNVFDPAENIGGGTQYIYKLLKLFDGDYTLALAGYNAGPETVKQYKGVPPYRETVNYVNRVLHYWNEYRLTGNSINYRKVEPPALKVAKAPQAAGTLTAIEPTVEVGDPDRDVHEVRLAGGTVHKAERVCGHGEHIYVVSEGRLYRLRKEHVTSIDGAAIAPSEEEDATQTAKVPGRQAPPPTRLAAQI